MAKCPKCSSPSGSVLSQTTGYLNDPPKDGEKPVVITTFYLCPCGETYSVTTKPDRPAQPPPDRTRSHGSRGP